MCPWVESFDPMAERITLLHWVPICHELMVCLQTFIEACLAREVTFSSIVIDETRLLQIVVVNILRAQTEFQVEHRVQFSLGCAHEATSRTCRVHDELRVFSCAAPAW